MKGWSAVVVFALSVTVAAAASQNIGPTRGPDSLILQGPGSDIRAAVGVLPVDQRPAGLSGVLVEQVTRDGPADTAGLRRGDIITEFDGVSITGVAQFGNVVRDTPPGRRVRAVVWRDGVRREVFVTPTAGRLQ
jgi:S1-C subfamily serine protease